MERFSCIFIPGSDKLLFSAITTRVFFILKRNQLIFFFFITHTLFSAFIGRLFALAPDEVGYLYTFNNIYGDSPDANPQYASGWIAAPKIFIWISYIPAKILFSFGVPDYLAIRILSISLATVSLYLLKNIFDSTFPDAKPSKKLVLLFFFIPSIYLWSSVGLRETFILAQISAFLTGLNFLNQGKYRLSFALLFLGSYGLISTKSYLWACLMLALLLSIAILLFQGFDRRKILRAFATGLLLPLIIFGCTTSIYALEFIFKSDISTAGERSGDSITQVAVEKEVITFHGGYTIIALHQNTISHPDSLFNKFLRVIELDRKIEFLWLEKVQAAQNQSDNEVGSNSYTLNGHILEPASIQKPASILRAGFVFLCGPFPFIGNPGAATKVASFESPLWWILYSLVIFQVIRFRKINFVRDPQIIFTLIFLAGEIVFSALVEVNLGTSFRHRSILLAPLVFLYIRIAQRAKEEKELELGGM